MEDIERLTEDYRVAVEARWEEYRALHSECVGVAQQARERAGEARVELEARAARIEAQARAALEEERERGEAAKRRAARLPELAGLLARLV
ncbi:hypothetical protein H632_c1573p1 [Helicosporidium sp. ATCC 50920]|nr:hypothetical protein H632_c1573p1 [Helicosporidium sp. ATCC 50920]|eukprot:KDD74100.1 hypothetical protein H632_c1573p1 [Helicosporidium sp. ATCC 50920]